MQPMNLSPLIWIVLNQDNNRATLVQWSHNYQTQSHFTFVWLRINPSLLVAFDWQTKACTRMPDVLLFYSWNKTEYRRMRCITCLQARLTRLNRISSHLLLNWTLISSVNSNYTGCISAGLECRMTAGFSTSIPNTCLHNTYSGKWWL